MSELDVRIVRLDPMRVASVRAISDEPEHEAWLKLQEWAEPRGLLDDLEKHPVFGFNNPNPSPDRKEYGYEFFLELKPSFEAEEGIQIEKLPGGQCAVLACKGVEHLPDSWTRLYGWVTDSGRKVADHGLEECLNPGEQDVSRLEFDLWLPVEE